MQWRGGFFVFLGAVSYGVLSTFVKLAYQAGFTVDIVVGTQMIVATLLLWLINLGYSLNRSSIKKASPFTRKQLLLLLLTGSLTGLTGLFYYSSLQYVNASFAILLLFQFSWMGLLYEAISRRRWPNKAKLISLIILLSGTLLATDVLTGEKNQWNWIGISFGLLAAISYAGFLILSGKAAVEMNPIRRSAWMTTGGLFLILLIYPPTYLIHGTIHYQIWIYALPLAVFGPVLSTILIAKGAPLISPGLTSILGAAELPSAMVMSTLVLHEQVNQLQWFGVILILLGIAIPELLHNKKDRYEV
ncbi:Permease of the drug/metabolite transporter (DMT) superfamily [Seinonella peptonophila]|uniref:Permease of the drug/metabolite transporter (DMT) superfamily n=1 Tax=Seinonella peptonophila TaxID=112248 RepID=A0A1M4TLS3_9BACL|nr:DMT family transporter [Seinonella peptonophila]SHE45346.1 Permease of the drug/metabolite transporter (DMT) superfamily [Seinonella peptonophila]